MSRAGFEAMEQEFSEREERLDVARASRLRHQEEQQSLSASIADLSTTALRVKAERDEALKLLRRVLQVREMGLQGPMKSDIRHFLSRVA